MKQILLVRHAKSSWADMLQADHDRSLNDRGKRDAPFMAQKLVAEGLELHGILSSTATRALKTANAFRKAFELGKDQVLQSRSLYHAGPQQIIEQINALPESWSKVAVFGHNPGFTDLANRISGSYIDNVPTCGILGSSSDVTTWAEWSPDVAVRLFFYYPKLWLN